MLFCTPRLEISWSSEHQASPCAASMEIDETLNRPESDEISKASALSPGTTAGLILLNQGRRFLLNQVRRDPTRVTAFPTR